MVFSANAEPIFGGTPGDIVSALDRDAATSDLLPKELDTTMLGTGGLDSSSLRVLGEDETTEYRVGLDKAGQICLVVTLKDALLVTASTCERAGVVEQEGLHLGIQGNETEGSIEQTVYLLPDATDERTAQDLWKHVGSNILVAPTDIADAAKSRILPSEDGKGPAISIG
ncbi:MAG: hypothetical protein ACSHW9_01750 [Salinibacterium amurskyense]